MAQDNVQFTSLMPVHGDAPLCYLLTINGFNFLLDCGWDESCDESALEKVKEVAPRIDAVLLSHGTLAHLGALPYLVRRAGLAAPVFSTLPVRRMGEMALYDLYLTKHASSDFSAFGLDDVDAAFSSSKWVQLHYHQPFSFAGRGLTITAYNAGHTVGGSIWAVRLQGGSEVVYAVDFCHKKERHLNEASLSDHFLRPALLITDTLAAQAPHTQAARRDAEFIDTLLRVLRGNGSVLLPVDSAGRVLELIALLEEVWVRDKIPYPIAFLSDMAHTVLKFASSQLEFMAEGVRRGFERKRVNPWEPLRAVRLCSSWAALQRLPPGPKVVLATSPSLDCGYSQQLLLEWGASEANAVLLVQRPPGGSTAHRLLQHAAMASAAPGQGQQQGQGQGQGHQAGPLKLELKVGKRVPLEGAELEQWQEEQRKKKTGEAAAGASEAGTEPAADVTASDMELDAIFSGKGSQPLPAVAGTGAAGASNSAGAGPSSRPMRYSSGSISRIAKDAATGTLVQHVAGAKQGAAPQLHPGWRARDEEVLMDGFLPPEGAAAPMFPDEDEAWHEQWDEYGALPDPAWAGDLLRGGPGSGVMQGLEGLGQMGWEGDEGAMDGLGVPEEPAQPTKVITSVETLELKAFVRYFDYDGRVDGRIIRQALSDIAPLALLLLHGPPGATRQLAEHSRGELREFKTRVVEPCEAEPVTLALPPSQRAVLSSQLHAMLTQRSYRLGPYALTWLDAQVAGVADPAQAGGVSLQLLPNEDADLADTGSVFVADGSDGIRLSDVKKALADAGLESYFGPGCLVCGNVTISKGGGDKAHLLLEGALCKEYYAVRDVIYQQYSGFMVES